MMSDTSKKRFKFLRPLLIVLVGVLIMVALASSRKKPQKASHKSNGALVEVVKVSRETRNIVIEGNGTVQPRYEISLIPQVSGKVVWVHPSFLAGGSFHKGAELIKIEPADYELAVQQAQALVAQAEYQLDVAKANAAVARREWEMMNNTFGMDDSSDRDEPDPLVLHEPQLRQANAGLASAKATLERANLNLERTTLAAPFNCRVRNRSVAVGQLVGMNAPVAYLYATDLVDIEIGLTIADLAWIKVPGAKATVTLKTSEGSYLWQGRVDRSVGVVDQIGRLAKVVVQVNNPFKRSDTRVPELSIGSFVSVIIEGRTVENTLIIPRSAMRENNTVWIATKDNTLDIREVELNRLTPTDALIFSGVEEGDMIILTTLSGAANGMKLRPTLVEEAE